MAAMEKNNKNLNVPNLRFPEFSGEWDNVSLGDISDITKLAGFEFTQYVQYEDSGNIIALRGLNCKNGSLDLTDVKYIDNSILEKLTRSKLYVGDILFTYVGTVGEVAIIEENDRFYLAPNVSRIRVEQGYNPYFIKQLIHTKRFYNKIIFPLIATSSQPALSMENVRKFSLSIPQESEQGKLAEFLNILDQRISTQKKIIEDLKKLKDAISNQNFTTGSALKLGNVGKFIRGLTYSASDVIDDTMGTAVMRSNNISNGDPVNFEELVWVNKTPNHEQILRSGDIVICMANGSSPLVGKASYYVDCGIESATVGAFCGIYRSDNPLTKWLFQSKHYKKHIQRCIQGGNGAIANIYPEDILAISFNIPSGYERVLNILNSLEDKYLLEQKLLCRYLAVKSHLLAQMFI